MGKKNNTLLIIILGILLVLALYNGNYKSIIPKLFVSGEITTVDNLNILQRSFTDAYPTTVKDFDFPQCPTHYYAPNCYFGECFPATIVERCKWPPIYGRTPAGLQCATLCYKIVDVDGTWLWSYDILKKDYQCFSPSDCGGDGYVGKPYCKNDNVYQNYITYSCSSFLCSNAQSEKLLKNCANGCSNGECNPVPFEGTACSTEGETISYAGVAYTCYNGYYINTQELLRLYKQGKPPSIFALTKLGEIWGDFLNWLNNLFG